MKIKSLKLLTPPILWEFLKKIYLKIKKKNLKTDNRKWWEGEKIKSNNYRFKKIFKNFDQICYAITILNETRDCIEILPSKKKTFQINENIGNLNEILIGLGNISEGDYLKGSYIIKIDKKNLINLNKPSCKKWENFKISLNLKKEIEIINNTNESLYFSCPSILESSHKNDIKNFFIIILDQVDYNLFNELEKNQSLPFISNFFKNCIEFSNYHSSSEWTMPSIYSFVTGKHSSEHGLFDFNITKDLSYINEKDNLINFFNKKNYFNICVSRSKGHHPGFNFQKNFDRFFYFPANRNSFREVNFEQIVLEHVETNLHGKNFALIHYLSSHVPFYGNSINEDINLNLNRIGYPLKDYENSIIDTGTSKIEKIVDKIKIKNVLKRRKERLRSLDLSLSKLFNFIDNKIKENSIVLLTSDHGINHINEKDNTFLTKERINVPLKIFHPAIKEKYKIDEFYSSVDMIYLIQKLNKNYSNEIDLKKVFNKNANSEIMSESIFGNYYKVTILSKRVSFFHICYFDTKKRTVYLNKLAQTKLEFCHKEEDLNHDSKKSFFLEKVRSHLESNSILKVRI